MSDFTDAVAYRCDGHVATGAAACCPECVETFDVPTRDKRGRFLSTDAIQEELYAVDGGSFSRYECDSCGSRLGGDRHAAHLLDDKLGVIHLDICTDCLIFHANGEEPDGWKAL